MRASSTTIDLQWTEDRPVVTVAGELPWQRGMRVANELRNHLRIPTGPIDDETLQDLLKVQLPLASSWQGGRHLAGGFRNGITGGRTAILVTSRRKENQRCYLARLVASALAADAADHVLPVTDTNTALQKFERAFGQELLCPWQELDAFTDERGLDDEAVADAAEHFGVSQWLVQSALVNHGKLPRSRLPPSRGARP